MSTYLTTNDGKLISQFRRYSAPLWRLQELPRDQWVATCRDVGASLNQNIDPAKLAAADAAFPEPNVSSLLLDERTIVSQLLIACNRNDLETTENAVTRGVTVEELITGSIGASS